MDNINNLISKFDELNLDAVLLFDEINQFYLSRYKFSDGAILLTRDASYLITDFRYFEDAKSGHLKDYFEIVAPKSQIDFISDIIENHSIKNLGFEDDKLSYSRFLKLSKKFNNVSFFGIGETLSEMRTIKNDYEIEKIKRAQEITDKAFSHILNNISPNMTEIEVALELEFFMRKNGAEGIAFDTIAVSGNASSLPHGIPRNIPLQRGFLTMDFGARFGSYCSDMTRTVSIGKASEKMKNIYNVVLEAQKLGLEKIKAGAICSDVDKAARDFIDLNGYKNCFGHSLGHGVGLYIHEAPSLSYRSNNALKSGNVVTVEPGIYLEEDCGCRIEDMVLVKDDGYFNFTKSEKNLIEIF